MLLREHTVIDAPVRILILVIHDTIGMRLEVGDTVRMVGNIDSGNECSAGTAGESEKPNGLGGRPTSGSRTIDRCLWPTCPHDCR